MLYGLYRRDGKLSSLNVAEDLLNIDPLEVVWVDLFDATTSERDLVERHLGIELFTRQEAEEIESSSKYAESENEINANVNYIYESDGNYAVDPVSFILKNELLVTQRSIYLRSFEDTRRMFRGPLRPRSSGYQVFLYLLENRIDLEADFLENLSKKIYLTSRRLTLEKQIDEDVLIQINNFQELTILFRENTNELQRLISALLKSDYFPKGEQEKLRVMIKDAASLLSHTSFNFERLEYLQNTFLGLVDMEQNKIIKIFTVVTVIFMPPTLIASLYGMNFRVMPELHWAWGYPLAIVLMILSSSLTLLYFKKKRWL